jgi:hypothetical protein
MEKSQGWIEDGQMLKQASSKLILKSSKTQYFEQSKVAKKEAVIFIAENDPINHCWKNSVSFHFKDVLFLLE